MAIIKKIRELSRILSVSSNDALPIQTADGATGHILISDLPGLGGIISVPNGGTGQTSFTDGELLIGNSTGNTLSKATLTAGAGISVTNGSGTITVTNTAPDQVVSLTAGSNITISGAYPSFTIAATEQFLGTVTSVSGTGTVNGLTLTGTVTSSGSLTLGGTLSVDLSTSTVTGTLPVTKGGTGATSLTSGYLVKGNGTSAVSASVVYDNGTNVGIGNTNPAYPLEVTSISTGANGIAIRGRASDSISTHAFLSNDGATAYGKIQGRSTDLRLEASSSNTMTFYTNVTERMRLDASGNLGINATPAAWGANFKGIEGYGNSTFFLSGNSVNGITTVGNAYQNGTNWVYTTTGAAARYQVGTSVAPHIWSYAASGTGGTALTWTEGMRLDASGNVGIGTTSPGAKLQINSQDGFRFDVEAGVASTMRFGSAFTGEATAALAFVRSAGSITFSNGATGSALVERMRINSIGNVGIGTSAPSSYGKLTVNGNIVFGAPGGRNAAFTNNIGIWTTGDPVDDTRANIGFTTVAGASSSSSYITFATNNYGVSGGERMRIDSSGNVGVGLSNPGYPFTVQANSATQCIRLVGRAADSISTMEFTNSAQTVTQGYIQSNGNNLLFATGTTEKVRIDSSGNVGIGTTSPAGKLHVASGRIFLDADFSVSWQSGGVNRSRIVGDNVNSIIFENGSGNTERMRITDTGNVGIGTTAPTAKLDVNADTFRVRTAKTPASATATGNAGDICWDSNYIYVCVAANTWKRSALSTW